MANERVIAASDRGEWSRRASEWSRRVIVASDRGEWASVVANDRDKWASDYDEQSQSSSETP